MEGFYNTYYAQAEEEYVKYLAKFEEGNTANSYSDKQGLVTVIFAVVLFMLGIVSTFSNMKAKFIITGISATALVFGIIVMLSIPYIGL